MEGAPRLWTRDARLLYHAGMIYKVLDDRAAAAKCPKAALAVNPQFDVLQAGVAGHALRAINA